MTNSLHYEYYKVVMKKIAIILSVATAPFLTASTVFADAAINITPPSKGYNDLGKFVTNVINLALSLALLLVLVMLIWGAFEWITSGGDKEAVGKARGRIISALIGLAILAVAFALATVASLFLGFPDLRSIPIPTP